MRVERTIKARDQTSSGLVGDVVLAAGAVEDVAAEDRLDLGVAATTWRRRAAPFGLAFASTKATWADLPTRTTARDMRSLPWAGRGSQPSMQTSRSRSAGRRAGCADPGLAARRLRP